MKSKLSDIIVIHTHFHKRRTGVTRSVENVLPFLKVLAPTYLYGYGVEGEKISTKELRKILFSNKRVVVHCHRNNEIIKMLFYRLFGANFKLISTRHAETSPSGLTKFLLKKSDEVITLTTSMHQNLGIKNTKVSHGVDTDSFIPKEHVLLENIHHKKLIICAGRVREAKGHLVLIEGSAEVLKSNSDWGLIIVGKVDKQPFLEELKSLIKKHNIENQVYFINETPNIIRHYQASKIAIVPSYTEGFSLVCAEAMACSNTVIATKNVGVHSELISDKESGYLFEAGNTKELQGILSNLVSSSSPLLGEEARKTIVNEWSAKKEAEELFKCYLKVMG